MNDQDIIKQIQDEQKAWLDKIEKACTNLKDVPGSKFTVGDLVSFTHTYWDGSWNQYEHNVTVIGKVIAVIDSYSRIVYRVRYEFEGDHLDDFIYENQLEPVFTN